MATILEVHATVLAALQPLPALVTAAPMRFGP
jgi:hypothetical protein